MGPSLHAWEVLQIFRLILGWAQKSGLKSLYYKPVPKIYHASAAEDDLYALFRLGANLVGRDLSTCFALDQPLVLSKGRRSSLSKAERAGVIVHQSTNYKSFMDIVQRELLQKYGTEATHSSKEINLLAERFPDHIKLLVGMVEGSMVGGVVLYLTASVCHVQYIASNQRGKELGVVDICLSEAVSRYGLGRRWFDFGISTTSKGLNLNENLLLFKETWGGRSTVFDHYLVHF